MQRCDESGDIAHVIIRQTRTTHVPQFKALSPQPSTEKPRNTIASPQFVQSLRAIIIIRQANNNSQPSVRAIIVPDHHQTKRTTLNPQFVQSLCAIIIR